ncbi:MAG: hypothetical protein KGL39_55950 [Patescibacteria group bacterium]|nr:hypothetical protein [Patescibacteria group bacterium]
MEVVTHTTPLTADNLPEGNLWEMDGACWHALRSITNPDEWRWSPVNRKAEIKGKPTGEMFDYYPIVGGLPQRKK